MPCSTPCSSGSTHGCAPTSPRGLSAESLTSRTENFFRFRKYVWVYFFLSTLLFCLYELGCMKELVDETIGIKAKELKEYVDIAIAEALRKYDADKTGLVDFALKSVGGEIVSTRDTEQYVKDWSYSYFGLYSCATIVPPSTILQAKSQPGECWPFVGSKGTAVIKLISPVVITGLTYEHIAKSLLVKEDISSAPLEFSLKGIVNPDDKTDTGFNFGVFTYDANGPPVQYFPIQHTSERAYKYAEFTILNNHGNKNFTCVYRVRIHGTV